LLDTSRLHPSHSSRRCFYTRRDAANVTPAVWKIVTARFNPDQARVAGVSLI
jgi:hypothetical protein